jgi:hypothetical protein
VYPETPVPSKGSKSTHIATRESPGSSSDEYEEEDVAERTALDTIPDEDEPGNAASLETTSASSTQRGSLSHSTAGQQVGTRQTSETPSLVQDKGASPTPSTEGSVGYPGYQTASGSRVQKQSFSATGTDGLRSDWSHLPPDLQFYMTYFYENLSYLHYSLKFDSGNFLKTLFIDAALRNEALLYAVVGFSAFQRTLNITTKPCLYFLNR